MMVYGLIYHKESSQKSHSFFQLKRSNVDSRLTANSTKNKENILTDSFTEVKRSQTFEHFCSGGQQGDECVSPCVIISSCIGGGRTGGWGGTGWGGWADRYSACSFQMQFVRFTALSHLTGRLIIYFLGFKLTALKRAGKIGLATVQHYH